MASWLKMLLLGLALLGLCLPMAFSQEDAPAEDGEAAEINEEKVVVLTNENFDNVTKESQYTLVRSPMALPITSFDALSVLNQTHAICGTRRSHADLKAFSGPVLACVYTGCFEPSREVPELDDPVNRSASSGQGGDWKLSSLACRLNFMLRGVDTVRYALFVCRFSVNWCSCHSSHVGVECSGVAASSGNLRPRLSAVIGPGVRQRCSQTG